MQNLYNWSKKNIVTWLSNAIFFTTLLLFLWLIWQVITKVELETSQLNPTQIKLDLLQASAFLVAWSGLLIAITAKVIDMFRHLDILTREANWRFKEHIEGHPDMEKQIEELQTWTDRIDEEYDKARDELSRVQTENERLTAENEQLRRQIQGVEEATASGSEDD